VAFTNLERQHRYLARLRASGIGQYAIRCHPGGGLLRNRNEGTIRCFANLAQAKAFAKNEGKAIPGVEFIPIPMPAEALKEIERVERRLNELTVTQAFDRAKKRKK
jgi:hypothetical protein